MAVYSYLMQWDQTHLSDRFVNVTLDKFLALPHKQLMADYGETFATQHKNLCNTLRKVLFQKRLVDRTESPPRAPRKKKPSNEDSLILNVGRLSIVDRLGDKRTGCPRHIAATDPSVTCTDRKERVSVKERLGDPVRWGTRGPGCRVRLVDRMQNERPQHPGRMRQASRNSGYYLPNHHGETPSRYGGRRGNTRRKTYNN